MVGGGEVVSGDRVVGGDKVMGGDKVVGGSTNVDMGTSDLFTTQITHTHNTHTQPSVLLSLWLCSCGDFSEAPRHPVKQSSRSDSLIST